MKPIILEQVGSRWEVYVDPKAARRFGARGSRVKSWPEEGRLVVTREGKTVDIVADGKPAKFTKSEADHVAHMIGRYMLGLGDFVDTYVDVRRTAKERDASSKRSARGGWQRFKEGRSMASRDRRPRRRKAVRIPRSERARTSRRVRELVRQGYEPRYAARLAYHGRDASSRDRLTASERRRLPSVRFALPKRRALPLSDASHVRNAAARLEQMHRRGTVTEREYRGALRRIVRAETRLGIRHGRERSGGRRNLRRARSRDPKRTIYISRSQNLAALIDNAYGHLTSREASGLVRAIDDAEREGHDPRRAAIAYLRELDVDVQITGEEPSRDRRRARGRGRRDLRAHRTHRGNADLIRWYLKHAHDIERQLFSGTSDSERRRKARATVAKNVQILRRVDRRKGLNFVRSLGYRG